MAWYLVGQVYSRPCGLYSPDDTPHLLPFVSQYTCFGHDTAFCLAFLLTISLVQRSSSNLFLVLAFLRKIFLRAVFQIKMAGLLSFTFTLLLAVICQASPQILAANVKDAAIDVGSGQATITDVGGNVIECSSQIAFVISETTYLDCVGAAKTISTGSATASDLSLITTTNAKGAPITELSLQFSGATTLVTLISVSETLLEAPTATTETIQTVNAKGSTVSEVIVVQDSSTSIESTITPLQIPTKTMKTITTTDSQGSTITEIVVVTGSSTSVVSTLGSPGKGTATKTIATTNAQGSTISEVIVVVGSSTSIVSTLGSAGKGTKTETVATTNAQGSTISELIVVVGSSTKIVSTIAPPKITSEVTSTVKTTDSSGQSITYVIVVAPSTTETVSTLTSDTITSPTFTETVLPPGASIETLPSGAYLTDTWITTKKPGSSSETVVPIIVPSAGPPIVIWGIVPDPPPGGWEINIPGFPCFEIFGIKIGDCPPSGSNPGKTGKGTATSPSATETDSKTCSKTTATITTVSCLTSGASSSCTTLTTPTVGCSATGSAVTTGSCVAKTTLGGTTSCCSSATVTAGSTVCEFASMTQLDMYVMAPTQIAIAAAQLMSQLSAYTATAAGGKTKTGTATATGATPLCVAYSGPDTTGDICVCSTGTIIQTISSYLNPTSNVCGYTTLPSPTNKTPAPASTTPKATSEIKTVTDPNNGQIEACTSISVGVVAGYTVTACAGSITTIKSASKTSTTSTTTKTAAASSGTAEILINFYEYYYDEVYLYQYRAYDGTPGETVDYCGSATPIGFVTLDNSNGDSSVLPTDQLPTFTTHGIKDCTYSSPSSSQAGSVNCPGWTSKVQCQDLVGQSESKQVRKLSHSSRAISRVS